MRKYTGGYEEVKVWSETEEAHEAALDVYRIRGWEYAGKQVAKGGAMPYQSTVRRKLKYIGDDPA